MAIKKDKFSEYLDISIAGITQRFRTVSWDDCMRFIRELNDGSTDGFRLPTGAEWEYAYRAGTPFNFGRQIDTNKVNNVWEWVEDWYGEYQSGNVTGPSSGRFRVLRGGCWIHDSGCGLWPTDRFNDTGFRLALSEKD